MEGMIGNDLIKIQSDFMDIGNSWMGMATWAWVLVTQLLETLHGQWLYRNIHI